MAGSAKQEDVHSAVSTIQRRFHKDTHGDGKLCIFMTRNSNMVPHHSILLFQLSEWQGHPQGRVGCPHLFPLQRWPCDYKLTRNRMGDKKKTANHDLIPSIHLLNGVFCKYDRLAFSNTSLVGMLH